MEADWSHCDPNWEAEWVQGVGWDCKPQDSSPMMCFLQRVPQPFHIASPASQTPKHGAGVFQGFVAWELWSCMECSYPGSFWDALSLPSEWQWAEHVYGLPYCFFAFLYFVVCVWSIDSLQESLLSCFVGLRDQAQVVSLGSKCLHHWDIPAALFICLFVCSLKLGLRI